MSVPALIWIDSIQVGNSTAKAFLRYLATHNFHKPGFFFKNETYCRAMEFSEKTLQRVLAFLEEKNLVTIERRHDDSGRQISNAIYLNVPDEFLNNYEKLIMGEGDTKNSPVKMTTLGATECRVPPRQDDDPYNNNKKNYKINSNGDTPKKSLKQETTLPDNFMTNESHIVLARDLNVNLSYELDQFKDHALRKNIKWTDWNAAFRSWIRKAADFKKLNVTAYQTITKKEELRSTVKEYGPGHELWEANQAWKRKQGSNHEQMGRQTGTASESRSSGVREVKDYLF